MIKRILSYLKTDLYRLLTSSNLWLSILGIQVLLFIISYSEFQYTVSVFYIIGTIFYGLPSVLFYIFCALPYACSFCEDIEFRFQYLMVSRGSIREYIFSKIITIVLSSCFVMVISIMLYISTLSFFIPWIDKGMGGDLTNIEFFKFGFLVENGQHIFFYFLYSMEKGLMNGILSLLAAFFSICLPNKLLTLSIPVMGAYFIYTLGVALGNNNPMMNLHYIFSFNYKIFSSDILSFLYSAGISFACYIMISIAIFIKVRRRYYD